MLHQQRQPIHMSHSVVTQNRRFSQQHPQQVQQQLQASGSSTFMMNAPPLPQGFVSRINFQKQDGNSISLPRFILLCTANRSEISELF